MTILPGVRDLRAPLVAGLLWLAVGSFAGVFTAAQLTAFLAEGLGSPEYVTLVQVPVAVSLAYFVGLTMQSVTVPVLRYLGKGVRSLAGWATSFSKMTWRKGEFVYRRPAVFFRTVSRLESALRVWPLGVSSRTLLLDSVDDRLAAAGSSGSVGLWFPSGYAITALPHCAAQLAHHAPTQYQEFDRLKSEVELRLAIALPLFALALVLPVRQAGLVLVGGIVVAVVLLAQATVRERRSMDLLANAAYLGYVEIPMVKAVAEGVRALRPMPESEEDWAAAIVTVLHKRAYFTEAEEVLAKAFRLCQDQDVKNPHAIERYLMENCSEMFDHWNSLEERYGAFEPVIPAAER